MEPQNGLGEKEVRAYDKCDAVLHSHGLKGEGHYTVLVKLVRDFFLEGFADGYIPNLADFCKDFSKHVMEDAQTHAYNKSLFDDDTLRKHFGMEIK